jgi:hypothetical protein
MELNTTETDARRKVRRWHESSLILTFFSTGLYSGACAHRYLHDPQRAEGWALAAMFIGTAAATLIWFVKVRGRLDP